MAELGVVDFALLLGGAITATWAYTEGNMYVAGVGTGVTAAEIINIFLLP